MNHIEFLLQTNPEKLAKRLGRLPAPDPNDEKYPVMRRAAPVTKTEKYHYDSGLFLDQLDTPKCTEFSAHHFLLDGPITHGKKPLWEFGSIYSEAQKVDEWDGENYEGTSVRATAKVLQAKGYIKEYRWASTLSELVNTVLTTSPVIVGTNWYWNMFTPDKKGLIKIGDEICGGHAWCITGVNTKTKLLRLKNSWGKGWGVGGRAFISFSDMERLLSEDGECCLPVENANFKLQ